MARCVTAAIAVSGVPVGDEPWPGVLLLLLPCEVCLLATSRVRCVTDVIDCQVCLLETSPGQVCYCLD